MDARPAHYRSRPRDLLTPRQREVLDLVVRGYTNSQIADELGVTLDGAKYHVSEILARLDVASREEAVAAWRAQRRQRQFRRLWWPVSMPWLGPAVMGTVAVGVGLGALALALALTRDGDHDGDATARSASESVTPTNVSAAGGNDGVPANCPADAARMVHRAFGPAAGNGPVYLAPGEPASDGQRTLTYHPAGRLDSFPGGWGGSPIMFVVDPTYQGPITVAGTRLDGPGEADFVGPATHALLPPGAQPASGDAGFMVMSMTTDGWRNYAAAILIRLDRPGCYALDFSGAGLSERVVFWAQEAPAATGATPPASGSPVPSACGSGASGGASVIDWVPFVRLRGHSYLRYRWGEAPVGQLAVDPSLAGRQVGTVLWNVNDDATDPCHAQLDGSSSSLAVGTPLYEMAGYDSDFRLIAETPLGWRIFESDWRDGAKTAAELLDIRGKVVSLTVSRREFGAGGASQNWVVTEPKRVDDLVERLLSERLTFSALPAGTEPPGLDVTFRLTDGTTVQRFWFAGPQAYSSGIPVAEGFLKTLVAELAND